jgi:hypothetical protein
MEIQGIVPVARNNGALIKMIMVAVGIIFDQSYQKWLK